MQNGPKTIAKAHQPRPVASFVARSKRWTSRAARPEPKGSQNAQRNYDRGNEGWMPSGNKFSPASVVCTRAAASPAPRLRSPGEPQAVEQAAGALTKKKWR
jgi:hypothetical protein